MEMYKLSKSDWSKLNKLGLVSGEGNGFAYTTDKFDKEINCSSFRPTFIYVQGMQFTFVVQYMDGCFYPIWQKSFVESDKIQYYIDKKGLIS
jgi:hypothetical protein